MLKIPQIALVYEVSVEHTTLRLTSRKGITGYSVHLDGAFDERWVEAFQFERSESRKLSRFDVNPSTATVWFPRDQGSDPADVIDALDVLATLVEHVNERASYGRR